MRPCAGDPVRFEGLRYQTLSKKGLGISIGSGALTVVQPEDFIFERIDGTRDYATPARTVVDQMRDRATTLSA